MLGSVFRQNNLVIDGFSINSKEMLGFCQSLIFEMIMHVDPFTCHLQSALFMLRSEYFVEPAVSAITAAGSPPTLHHGSLSD